MKKKKEITEQGLLKKNIAYAITRKIFSSFLTLPTGLYLGRSIARGDLEEIVLSSLVCVAVITTAVVSGIQEEKTDAQLKEYYKNNPTRKPPVTDDDEDDLDDIILEDYREIE